MHILETGLYVDNIDVAEKFYVEILGGDFVGKKDNRHLFIGIGDRMLVIFNPEETTKSGGLVPVHGSHGQGHMAFGVSKEKLAFWKEELPRRGVEIEKEVLWEDKESRSIYFRDPSGNCLEFIDEDYWKNRIKNQS